MCIPDADMEVCLPDEAALGQVRATVVSKQLLNHDILQIRLQPETEFAYRPGQFLHLHHPNRQVRSYSIASVPELNELIEIHVRRIPGGAVSNWVHDELGIGQQVTIGGPAGNCFYSPHSTYGSILLAGTGSGLAPLYGIVRDALEHRHSGPITLIHGSLTVTGLYLMDELRQLAAKHANFTYTPAVLCEQAPNGGFSGKIEDAVSAAAPKPTDWRIYLCGDPALVTGLKRQVFLAGASMKNLYSDPFVMSK
jgi:NAD(P)H-flavin reductase